MLILKNKKLPKNEFQENFARAKDPAFAANLLLETIPDLTSAKKHIKDLLVKQIWPQPEGGFIVLYSLTIQTHEGEKSSFAGARFFNNSKAQEFHLQMKRKRPFDNLGKTSFVPWVNAVFHLFPEDFKLKKLSNSVNTSKTKKVFGQNMNKLFENKFYLEDLKTSPVSYWPGKKCLVKYDLKLSQPGTSRSERKIIYGKMYNYNQGKLLFEIMKDLWNSGFGSSENDNILIPEPRAYIPRFNMLVQEEIEGKRIYDSLPYALSESDIKAAAEGIACLHLSGKVIDKKHTLEDELRLIEEWGNATSEMFPDLKTDINRILQTISRCSVRVEENYSKTVHRDFYDKQVIINRKQGQKKITIIDLDTICQSDAALDVGNFLAHLTLRSLSSLVFPAFTRDWQARFSGSTARFFLS